MDAFLSHLKTLYLRVVALFCAIGVYALFGSPTPNNPGWAEALIGLGLVLAVGFSGAWSALKADMRAPLWQGAGSLLLIFGVTMPLLKGVLVGHEVAMILRDIIPFLFLLLPVFLAPLMRVQLDFIKKAVIAVVLLGVIFSLRALSEQAGQFITLISLIPASEELTYFANAPTVLFAALFLIGSAGLMVLEALNPARLLRIAGFVLLAGIVVIPIVLTQQRASLGYLVLYVGILGGIGLTRAPYRALTALAVLALCALPLYGALMDVAAALAQKTALVGINMRYAELNAVWRAISGGLFDLLFGTGWGGSFHSPAVGELEVNFTHSLLSSALLKTGLCGAALTGVYILGLTQILWAQLKLRPVLALALAGPLVIDVFLYASFKSLDFGLILLLIAGLGVSHQKSEAMRA
ncbi:MAG: hypothetical protein KDJ35_08730 [Alphaproteobacteria bacterium]|nr:hypothetical protein [Alphaproteobacteria bacterium]